MAIERDRSGMAVRLHLPVDLPARGVATQPCGNLECSSAVKVGSRGGHERRFCSPACRAKAYDRAHPRQRVIPQSPPIVALRKIGTPPAMTITERDALRARLKDQAFALVGLLCDHQPHDIGEMIRFGGVRFSARVDELSRAGYEVRGPRRSKKHGIMDLEPLVGGLERYRLARER